MGAGPLADADPLEAATGWTGMAIRSSPRAETGERQTVNVSNSVVANINTHNLFAEAITSTAFH